MRLHYMATMTTISVLGLGLASGCSNPCAAKPNSDSAPTEVQANPCASKTNPCASKTNPCASKANPCAAKK